MKQQRIPRNLFYLQPSEKPELIKLGHALFLFQIASQSQFSQFFPCDLLGLRSGVMGLVSFPAPFSSPSPDNEGPFELT